MKTVQDFGRILSVLFIIGSMDNINCEQELVNLQDVYDYAVNEGIIDQRKYPFEAFESDERSIFRDIYQEYKALNISEPFEYKEWLLFNNFGLLPDTKESVFQRKISKRSTADNKRQFVATVKKGDILITNRGSGGQVGHAAIMTTDYWVLEMPGGSGWGNGIPDNNRQVPKDEWFNIHEADWTTVYRCPHTVAASEAADWADHTYYNPSGGATKVKHITYRLTTDNVSIDPSYSSKLVVQAYYFGTGSKQVIKNLSSVKEVIAPLSIPSYFLSPYKLINKGTF